MENIDLNLFFAAEWLYRSIYIWNYLYMDKRKGRTWTLALDSWHFYTFDWTFGTCHRPFDLRHLLRAVWPLTLAVGQNFKFGTWTSTLLHFWLDTRHLMMATWNSPLATGRLAFDTCWWPKLQARYLNPGIYTLSTWNLTLGTWHFALDAWHLTHDIIPHLISTSKYSFLIQKK